VEWCRGEAEDIDQGKVVTQGIAKQQVQDLPPVDIHHPNG